VASSLYYLHLNTEDDARLLAEDEGNAISEEPAEPIAATQKPLPRKPLPETLRSSLDVHRSGEPIISRPAVQPAPHYLHRKPLSEPARSSLDLKHPENHLEHFGQGVPFPIGREVQRKEVASRGLPNQPPDQANETVQRRPLGPRPLQSEAIIGQQPLTGVENQPLNSRSQVSDFITSKVSSDSGRSDFSNYDGIKRSGSAKSFSITIIRRDPSSGAQWNVGGLLGESHSRGMKAMSNPRKPYFDISVHLTTPGYTPFRNSQAQGFNDKPSQLHSQQNAVNDSGATGPDWGFERDLRMEGSSIWERASQQHKRSRSDISGTRPETRESTAVRPGLMPDNSRSDTHDSGSRGYVFLSPWGGRCKFSTGGGGRSLRCKHTLPDSLSSSNAVFETSGSSVVSELRFNLPHSALFKALDVKNAKREGVESSRFSIPKFDHIRNKLSQGSRPPPPPRQHPTSYAAMYPSDDEEPPPLPPRVHAEQRMANSSDEQEPPPISIGSHHSDYTLRSPTEEDDERLDLSIGREKAGGGNRGKRAKLGKLIIHDEGFKMLDLVVAANMGVWWSIY
jgi:hypothetical protein